MTEYYGNNDYRDYLIHYGIPGMKWGKRKIKELKNAVKPYTKKYKKAHEENERANWKGIERTQTEHYRKGRKNFDKYNDIQKEMWYDRNREILDDRYSDKYRRHLSEHVRNYYPKDEKAARDNRDKALRRVRQRMRRKRYPND